MPEIRKVRYNHDAIIDAIIAEPTITQNELCKIFQRTPAWMSIIINSDAFKHRLAERKEELVDPLIAASVNDRLQALAAVSSEKLLARLASDSLSAKEMTSILKVSADSLGLGKPQQSSGVNLYVVNAPQPAASATEWAAQARGEVVNLPTQPGV